MSRMQRTKGARGQTQAAHLFRDRDWSVIQATSGIKTEDFVVESPEGKRHSVEVKNCKLLNIQAFVKQAQQQAKARKLPWMLLAHIWGTSSWLVMRQGEPSQIWHQKGQNAP